MYTPEPYATLVECWEFFKDNGETFVTSVWLESATAEKTAATLARALGGDTIGQKEMSGIVRPE